MQELSGFGRFFLARDLRTLLTSSIIADIPTGNAQTASMPLPWKKLPKRLRISAMTVLLLCLMTAVYTFTLHRAAPDLVRAKVRIKTQRAEIRSLTSRLEDSKLQQKVAEHEANVIRRANQLLREEESGRQTELNRLQGELEFYQRLAGTSGTQSGLAVYHLELSPTGSGRVFRYILTLTQNLRRSAIINGSVRMELEGTLDDKPLKLPWSRLSESSQATTEFRFKYFQQLEGYIALPEHFVPSRMLVTLTTKGQGKTLSRSFDWNTLTAPRSEPIPETSETTGLELELGETPGAEEEND